MSQQDSARRHIAADRQSLLGEVNEEQSIDGSWWTLEDFKGQNSGAKSALGRRKYSIRDHKLQRLTAARTATASCGKNRFASPRNDKELRHHDE